MVSMGMHYLVIELETPIDYRSVLFKHDRHSLATYPHGWHDDQRAAWIPLSVSSTHTHAKYWVIWCNTIHEHRIELHCTPYLWRDKVFGYLDATAEIPHLVCRNKSLKTVFVSLSRNHRIRWPEIHLTAEMILVSVPLRETKSAFCAPCPVF